MYSKRRGNQRLCICNVIVIIRVRKNKGGVSYELLWWLVKGRDGKREQWKGWSVMWWMEERGWGWWNGDKAKPLFLTSQDFFHLLHSTSLLFSSTYHTHPSHAIFQSHSLFFTHSLLTQSIFLVNQPPHFQDNLGSNYYSNHLKLHAMFIGFPAPTPKCCTLISTFGYYCSIIFTQQQF